jgi:sulfite reductase alpha subunit-like flavoprotein
LSRLEVAFSRDSTKKVYVQHLLKAQSENIWNLVENQGVSVYICGGTGMGRDVREVFISIFVEFGKMTTEAATSKLRTLQNSGKFIQELWG